MEREDLRTALPKPPSPRPASREAAIAAALDRFDARDESKRMPDRRATRDATRWWSAIGRQQIAALATIAVVASVALPVWMSGDPRVAPAPKAVQSAAPSGAIARKSAPVGADAAPGPAMQPSQTPEPAQDSAARVAEAPRAPSAPTIANRSAMPSSELGDDRAETAAFASSSPPPPPPSATVAAPIEAPRSERDASREDIVVTGSRVAPSPVAEPMPTRQHRRTESIARRNWDVCTVNDPRPDPHACGPLDDPGTAGSVPRAAALVTDGLMQTWRGDVDGAIITFGRAIEISPRLASAYLNRGLAYQRKGDLTRALADLDRAVQYAPVAARGYYHRGLLRQQKGDRRGAQSDERRARALEERH